MGFIFRLWYYPQCMIDYPKFEKSEIQDTLDPKHFRCGDDQPILTKSSTVIGHKGS